MTAPPLLSGESHRRQGPAGFAGAFVSPETLFPLHFSPDWGILWGETSFPKESMEAIAMSLLKKGGSFVQGLMGNLSELDHAELLKHYGNYLMEGEEIQAGYQLIVDVILFTDRRLIWFDRVDAVSPKMTVCTIFLDAIVDVTLETAGIGIDDSVLTITYITSPYFQACHGIETQVRRYEFPKHYDVTPLYRMLQALAWENHTRINR